MYRFQATLAVVLIAIARLSIASVHCSIHGDTHVLMSDSSAKYQHHSAGLFRAFGTTFGSKRLDVQCEFTDRVQVLSPAILDPQMSSCRLKVIDLTLGCGVDVRHGGISQPGIGQIGGQDMPLGNMGQIAIEPALGMKVIPLTNNALSVEVNWNGTFIQVIMGERSLQVHSSMVQSCVGLCGTCSGPQQIPTDPTMLTSFIAQHVVPTTGAIQPDSLCPSMNLNNQLSSLNLGRIGASPQLFMQPTQTQVQYPVPGYKPATISDSLYTAQFESQSVLMQVFSQCSDNNQLRLQVDPWFNSFVEDCMYDKSLGPGFEASAVSSMQAYITWTESLLRWSRINAALRLTPNLAVCAACIPVQWTDPVHTVAILTPSVTVRRGSLTFPLRYSNSVTPYLIPNQFMNAFASSDFLTSPWNSAINLAPLSSLNLLPLPLKLVSSPIVVGENGQDVASSSTPSGLSWNPFPQQSAGSCGLVDQQLLSASDQLTSGFLQSSQISQLTQLIRQGRYPFMACALSCAGSQMLQQMPSLSSLTSTFTPMEMNTLCPNQQLFGNQGFGQQYPYPNQFFGQGNSFMPQQQMFPGQSNLLNQQFPGQQLFPGQNLLNQQQLFPGQNLVNQQQLFPGQNLLNQQQLFPGQNLLNQQQLFPGQNLLNQQQLFPGQNLLNQQPLIPGQSLLNQQPLIPGQNLLNQQQLIPGQNLLQQVPNQVLNGIPQQQLGLGNLIPNNLQQLSAQQQLNGLQGQGNLLTNTLQQQQAQQLAGQSALALQQNTLLTNQNAVLQQQQQPNTVLNQNSFMF